jgi:2-keto-4-pentenoate hydratase/2-oxohepta-3-ene-1,7-dioic acid hydratase in catechol pathway
MKIICVGRNYGEHIKELGNTNPEEPVIFLKPDTALSKSGQPIILPQHLGEIHYELELVFRIGRAGKHIEPEFAHRYIDQFSIGIDFTARQLQQNLKEKGLPWERAKAFDGSAVIGEMLPFESFDALMDSPFQLMLNQKKVQEGRMKEMIYSVPDLISFISKSFTLKTGDLIFTGTPKGVGAVKQGDELAGYFKDKLLLTGKIN